MRHCQYCDALNPDDALQCGNCGKSLPPAGKNIVSSSDKIPENADSSCRCSQELFLQSFWFAGKSWDI